MERKFISSQEFVKQERPFSYYLKDGTPCKMIIRTEGTYKEVTGTIRLAPKSAERLRRITLVRDDEEVELDVEDIMSIRKVE